MKIYNVTGSATTSDINEQAGPFSINVCATCKRDAYEYAYRGMVERGWRGVVVHKAEDLGSGTGWSPGETLLIDA